MLCASIVCDIVIAHDAPGIAERRVLQLDMARQRSHLRFFQQDLGYDMQQIQFLQGGIVPLLQSFFGKGRERSFLPNIKQVPAVPEGKLRQAALYALGQNAYGRFEDHRKEGARDRLQVDISQIRCASFRICPAESKKRRL